MSQATKVHRWKKARRTKPLRVSWMHAHKDLWIDKDLDADLHKQLVAHMKKDGVLNHNTYWSDVGVKGLIAQVKKEGNEQLSLWKED